MMPPFGDATVKDLRLDGADAEADSLNFAVRQIARCAASESQQMKAAEPGKSSGWQDGGSCVGERL